MAGELDERALYNAITQQQSEFDEAMSAWHNIAAELYDCLDKIRTAQRAINSGDSTLEKIGQSQLKIQGERADHLIARYGGTQ